MQTRVVASGVTSRAVRPVPPVVMTRRCVWAAEIRAASIIGCSSGSVAEAVTGKLLASSRARTAGPDSSGWIPWAQRSLMVMTKAGMLT